MDAVACARLAFRVLAFTKKNVYIARASIPNHELESVALSIKALGM